MIATLFKDTPGYSRTSAGHRVVNGVQFWSYRIGVLRYAKISDCGRAMVQLAGRGTYWVRIYGQEQERGPSGKIRRYLSESKALEAAAAKLKELGPS